MWHETSIAVSWVLTTNRSIPTGPRRGVGAEVQDLAVAEGHGVVYAGTEHEESPQGREVRARRRVEDGRGSDRLHGRNDEGGYVLLQRDPLEVRVDLEGRGPVAPVKVVRACPDAHRRVLRGLVVGEDHGPIVGVSHGEARPGGSSEPARPRTRRDRGGGGSGAPTAGPPGRRGTRRQGPGAARLRHRCPRRGRGPRRPARPRWAHGGSGRTHVCARGARTSSRR